MSVLTKNECGVTTILPLGVDCSVVDASTPLTNDGRIYLTITGGSSPYNITWSNGKKSQTIRNLTPGSYTGTVVDFYGDYTATTVCDVGSIQFFVDYFEPCSDDYNLYLTGITQNLIEGSVYKFTENEGCWTYSGKTLNGSNTITTDVITEGPYDTCLDCDPPIVLPYYPESLCLFTEEPYIAYPFELYGFVNGKPAYTGTSTNSSGYSINWFTGNTLPYWVVNGKTQLKNTSDTYNPLGGWKLEGTTQNWSAVSGTCPAVQNITIFTTTNDESCQGKCDGSVIINAKGGTGGYTYSLDGVNYTPVATFKNLCSKPNIPIYVKDSSGNTSLSSFTIKPGKIRPVYTVSAQRSGFYTTRNLGTKVARRNEYVFNVTPPLPDGLEITFNFSIDIDTYEYSPGKTNVSYNSFLYSGNTLLTPNFNGTITETVNTPAINSDRYPYLFTGRTKEVRYNTITLKKGLVVSGYLETDITKVANEVRFCGCKSWKVENPSNGSLNYTWVNCSGGTETNSILSKQVSEFCACSVSPGINSAALIISPTGKQSCLALTDGTIGAVFRVGNSTINDTCTTLQVEQPDSSGTGHGLYFAF